MLAPGELPQLKRADLRDEKKQKKENTEQVGINSKDNDF